MLRLSDDSTIIKETPNQKIKNKKANEKTNKSTKTKGLTMGIIKKNAK